MEYIRYTRGQAMGIAFAIMFTGPLFTVFAAIFIGWWALLVYPAYIGWVIVLTNKQARERAERWASVD